MLAADAHRRVTVESPRPWGIERLNQHLKKGGALNAHLKKGATNATPEKMPRVYITEVSAKLYVHGHTV